MRNSTSGSRRLYHLKVRIRPMTKKKTTQAAPTAQERFEAAQAAYDAAEVEVVDREHELTQVNEEIGRLFDMSSGNRTAMGTDARGNSVFESRVSELKA